MSFKYFIIIQCLSFFFTSCTSKVSNPKISNHSFIKVAVFEGNGAGEVSVIETLEALKIDSNIMASSITAWQITDGALDSFDVIIFPGGSGSQQLNNLGQIGAEIVLDFVKNKGKGVVGICAGAYLLSSTDDYPNLDIVSSIHLDRDHYNRGRGLVEIGLTNKGLRFFPELQNHRVFIQYFDGPVLQIDSINNNKINSLGYYISDIHPDNFAPKGFTPYKDFIVSEEVDEGRALIIAGHPESTPGMRWMIPRMVRWVAKKPLISYHKNWVRPWIYDSLSVFSKEIRIKEKQLFWNLFDSSTTTVVESMVLLDSLKSRPAVRWTVGLLRHKNPIIRRKSAQFIALHEYTFALPDLFVAEKSESDSITKAVIRESIGFLLLH